MYRFKKLYKFFSLAFICATWHVLLHSQSSKTVFQHITIRNGLSQNTISAIHRDSRGLLWIGTLNGLNCYNGYNTLIFKSDSGSNSISNNQVNAICEDEEGNLWIGTRNGLNKYIFKENRFVQFFNDPKQINSISDNYIRFLFKDSKHNIWICENTGGLDKLTLSNNKVQFTHYPFSPIEGKGVSAPRVNCILEDHSGKFWIGTADGLDILNPFNNNITTLKHNPFNNNSITNNSVNTLFEENDSIMWIGAKLGLSRLNTKSFMYNRYFSVDNDPESLSNNAIRFINRDNSGTILIGTLGGLHKFLPSKNKFSRFKINPSGEFDLNNEFISYILNDFEGNVWVGTEKGGINKYTVPQQPFYNFEYQPGNNTSLNTPLVNSVYDDGSYLWIGTGGGGINKYDKKSHKFDYFLANSLKANSLSFNFISNITKDSNGSLWFSTWGLGINKLLNAQKGTFKSYYFNSAHTDSINWNLVSFALEFPKGNLWIGSRLGLSRMDISTEKIEILNISTPDTLPLMRVSCLLLDKFNTLWVGSENGLYRLKWNNLKNMNLSKPDSVFKFYHHSNDPKAISGNHIVDIHEDKNGVLWVSVLGFGLEKILPSPYGNNVHFIHLNKMNQSINEIIYGILEDNKNNIWFSTENGLQKYNPKTNQCQTYYESDGLQGNQFYWSAFHKNKEGTLYFGGTQGLSCFNPDSIKPNRLIEKVLFTDLKIFNKSVPKLYNIKNSLTQHITTSDTVYLKYKQNMFTLEFTGLNYDIISSSEYTYQLAGFDEDWIHVDNKRRYATYTNLSPGLYQFKVKVANRDGIWSQNEAEMVIIIKPEWWQTLFFKITIFVLVCLILLTYYLSRIRILKHRQQKLEFLVNQRTQILHQQNQEIIAQKEEILTQNQEILSQKDEILAQRDEIANQNTQLLTYGNHLEEMVAERTRDLELAKNKAEEADKLKSSFLTNLSHEIRTPMNAIVGFSSLIAEKATVDDTIKGWSLLIMKNSHSLMYLIDDIIDFAKVETGQIKISRQNLNVYSILNELFENILIKAKQKFITLKPEVQFKFEIPEEYKTLKFTVDPNRLTQIINNLVTNAIKFTEQGSIEIGFKPENEMLLFWVKDTGIGIKKSNYDIIFERFRKIEDNSNVLYRGAGLGLALVKSLVELMGGKIWVESEPCKGSVFYFTVSPGNISEEINSKGTETHFENKNIPTSTELKILIAEDDDTNFIYLNTILKSGNIAITRASNGQEAVDIINNRPRFDIIIMDIKMPVMNGFKATLKIKTTHPEIPVIAVTAYALADEKEQILNSNFDGYIAKPVNKVELLNLIKKLTHKNWY